MLICDGYTKEYILFSHFSKFSSDSQNNLHQLSHFTHISMQYLYIVEFIHVLYMREIFAAI